MDEEDEVEPLEVISLPVRLEAYDAPGAGENTVRLFFTPGPSESLPGGDLAGVVVLEAIDTVAIGLTRRLLVGDGPDNVEYGGELLIAGRQTSLDVDLREPLQNRALIDAATGERVGLIKRPAADVLMLAEEHGTPRWRW